MALFPLRLIFLGGGVPNMCFFRIFAGAKNVCVLCIADIRQIYDMKYEMCLS